LPGSSLIVVRPGIQDWPVIRELLPPDTHLGYSAMRALRTGLADEESFVSRVDGTQRLQSYRLVGVFEGSDPEAVAVAGFRVIDTLAWGHCLYVDDLSTLPEARRRGHGRALLDWLGEEAQRLGCDQFHLDSGVGIERADAHRLYLNSGLRITAHHFARHVGD
jgi:GNAT superfamily N-acetyltransferase